ncbi:hypothetical protein LWC35_07590 [Pseudonocardia kujensis]|uniref:hypothetical protein n=1 Tax=Pseudonocardia kujensis TaxID=1128675 RepID=UPI001E4D3F89|nr:hypothetical protein [Pseudonocardia kujensis]MCE0762773.1 hypothetical protein [Pseudonocardia kujensis]
MSNMSTNSAKNAPRVADRRFAARSGVSTSPRYPARTARFLSLVSLPAIAQSHLVAPLRT